MTDRFEEPRLAVNRVYTRHGDAGRTRLVGGQEVSKASPRIEVYGTVDELNAHLGAATLSVEALGLDELSACLRRVQHELFNLGSILATLPEDVGPKQPRVCKDEVARLEAEIDTINASLPPLRSFVLPGGTRACVELHVCRTVCRRAERLLVALDEKDAVALAYLNRLSDAFFVFSRWVSMKAGVDEVLWAPNQTRPGSPARE